MPLVKGSSRQAIAENIRRLMREGYPRRQAVAIALETALRARHKRKSHPKSLAEALRRSGR